MKLKIEIKNRFTGKAIFELSTEDNTISKTLIEAIKSGANLYGANLDGANLDGANLDGANLVRANLVRANLDGANLDGANLDGANLYGANLVRANLDGANLVRANLDGANLDGALNLETSRLPMFCKWSHAIVGSEIKIGCKQMSITDWDLFFNSDKEFETKRGTKDFLHIRAVYESYKAYLTILNTQI